MALRLDRRPIKAGLEAAVRGAHSSALSDGALMVARRSRHDVPCADGGRPDSGRRRIGTRRASGPRHGPLYRVVRIVAVQGGLGCYTALPLLGRIRYTFQVSQPCRRPEKPCQSTVYRGCPESPLRDARYQSGKVREAPARRRKALRNQGFFVFWCPGSSIGIRRKWGYIPGERSTVPP